jgi:putative colanic acid biosynthesis UDP-glucose lipid carrier transferase
MTFIPSGQRSVLQRRSSITNTIQAALDGLAVIGITWFLIDHHIGVLNPDYTIMLLLLLGALAVIYDQYAIYRSNANFTLKALDLFKAWTLTFAFLVMMAFVTKQSEQYSRLLLGQLYVAGLSAQLLLHLAVRALQNTFLRHAHEPDNALIIGTGRLASFLSQKISTNPWLGERVIGCVRIGEAQHESGDVFSSHPGILGGVDDLDGLIDKHRTTRR